MPASWEPNQASGSLLKMPSPSSSRSKKASSSSASGWSGGRVLVTSILALAIGAAGGYGYSRYERDAQRLAAANETAALRSSLATRDMESAALRNQLDGIAGELAVERGARSEMERELGKIQAELGSARDQLAFYEQLVPAGPQGQVDIRAADLESSGQALRYRVLLTRYTRNETYISGTLQFVASGQLDGKAVTINLEPMRVGAPSGTDTDAEPSDLQDSLLSLRFSRYLLSQGVLAVPKGLTLQSVVVRVLEGDTVRASRKVDIAPGP